MTPVEVFQKVMAVCMMYPASVTGGGRTRKRNAAFDGHTNSRHLAWLAFDIVPDNRADEVGIINECTRAGLKAFVEDDPYHIHVQAP